MQQTVGDAIVSSVINVPRIKHLGSRSTGTPSRNISAIEDLHCIYAFPACCAVMMDTMSSKRPRLRAHRRQLAASAALSSPMPLFLPPPPPTNGASIRRTVSSPFHGSSAATRPASSPTACVCGWQGSAVGGGCRAKGLACWQAHGVVGASLWRLRHPRQVCWLLHKRQTANTPYGRC